MFGRKKIEPDPRIDTLIHVVTSLCKEITELALKVDRASTEQQGVTKMSDKLIQMAMVNNGNAREAVATRIQERMETPPFRAEVPEVDPEEDWPGEGCIEVTVP